MHLLTNATNRESHPVRPAVSNASACTVGSSLKACRIISSPNGVAGCRQFPVARANNTAGDVRSTIKSGLEDPFADPFSLGIIPDEEFLFDRPHGLVFSVRFLRMGPFADHSRQSSSNSDFKPRGKHRPVLRRE
jgi:hypothetical protein